MSTDFTFRDFLLSEALIAEENIVTMDVDAPNAQQEFKQKQRQGADITARKEIVSANQKKTIANQDREKAGTREGQLEKKEAAQAAALAKTRMSKTQAAKSAKTAR